MIPRIIHYVWVGGAPKPPVVKRCIESWRRFCPEWEIREWGDDMVERFGVQYAKEAYAKRKWAFVADWLRLHVLHEYGGFYLDSDLELLKPIDGFCDNDFVTGFIDRSPNVFLNMCFLGAAKGNGLIAEMLEEYGRIRFVGENGELDQTPNVVRFARYFASRGLDFSDAHAEVHISPRERIYPVEMFNSRSGYAYHHAAASWLDDWLRKVWLSVGSYKLVRFKKRKGMTSDAPVLLPGEQRVAGVRISRRKALWLVKTPPDPLKTIHVAIACNDAYAFPARVLISCVLRHASAPVRIHLLSTGLSDKAISGLRAMFRPGGPHDLDIHNNLEISFPLSLHCAHISKDTYLRLLLPEVLADIDRVIWLDIDLLVRGDIAPLWNADIGSAVLAGVVEEQMYTNGHPQNIGMKPGAKYFNAGVLVMNLAKIREQNIAEEWKRLSAKQAFRFLDQDVINISCENKIAELSMFWNFNLYYYRKYKPQKCKAKIIHFTGSEKPWTHPTAGRRCNREWWKAAARAGEKRMVR